MYEYELINCGEEYLAHHGILGMKWGIRRFQDKNGRLTALGRKRAMMDRESWNKEEVERNRKEAADRIEFYGGKNVAKARIESEADYKKRSTVGKAFVKELLAGVAAPTGLGIMNAAYQAEIVPLFAAGGAVSVGAIAAAVATAAGTKYAIKLIDEHAKDQIAYTMDSDAGADIHVKRSK